MSEKDEVLEVVTPAIPVEANGEPYGSAVESLGPVATFVYSGGSYQYFNTATGSNIDPWYNIKKAGTIVVEGDLFGVIPADIRPQTTDNVNGAYMYPGAVEYTGVWKLPVNTNSKNAGYTRGSRVYWVPASGSTEGYVATASDLSAGTYIGVGFIETDLAEGGETVDVILTPGCAGITKT